MSERKKTRDPQKENVTLGPTIRKEEQVFTFFHLSMTLTFMLQICLGEKHLYISQVERRSKMTRDESSPYAAMLAAQDVAKRCKELAITALRIEFRATGGNRTKHLVLVLNLL